MGLQETFAVLTDWLVVFAITVLLVAMYGSWLFSYRTPKTAPVGSNLWFILPPWAQIMAGFAISAGGVYICYLLWKPLPFDLPSGISLFLRITGIAFISSGIVLWFMARRALGAMMGVSTSSAVQLQVYHQLVQNGPYALVRHPMYLSYWLLLAGLTIMYQTWTPLILLLLTAVSLSRRAQREDQVLASRFGEEWQRYAKQVPAFIPRKKQRTELGIEGIREAGIHIP